MENFPKLTVSEVRKMTEEEAYEECKKRGLLEELPPEDAAEFAAMTDEELEEFKKLNGDDAVTTEPFKETLIESIVIDENGVFIGEEEGDSQLLPKTPELITEGHIFKIPKLINLGINKKEHSNESWSNSKNIPETDWKKYI